MSDLKPIVLSLEEALTLIADTPIINTIREVDGVPLSFKVLRKEVLLKMEKYPIELSGPLAREKGHGVCVIDDLGPLWIQDKAAVYASK